MEEAVTITRRRLAIWRRYHEAFEEFERAGSVRRPVIPDECTVNAHIYYLLLPGLKQRQQFIGMLKEAGILAVFHYVFLHDSPAGTAYGRVGSGMDVTNNVSARLVRLPLWIGLEAEQDQVIECCKRAIRSIC
jgi:dTDP-4-amino-4,6-dideoxygalactose transaminase